MRMPLKIPRCTNSFLKVSCCIFENEIMDVPPQPQYGREVTDFSSQYGSETSISYTACNLAGKCNIYPGYGDFTQACVLRTYGHWWKLAPSAKKKFKRTPPSFVSEDYIELSFDYDVYPTKIEIWETYNPGTIVRILACDTSGTDVDLGYASLVSETIGGVNWITGVEEQCYLIHRWKVLWEGMPEKCPPESRIFSPPLREINFVTNIIRLEFCHEKCDYYTELDAVRLHGYGREHVEHYKTLISGLEGIEKPTDIDKGEHLFDGIDQNMRDLSLKDKYSSENEFQELAVDTSNYPNITFEELPEEVIQLVLSYLDVPSLCIASKTSKFFHKHCYDSLQYRELDLQPHWTEVNSFALNSLVTRCQHLQHLNISWCGGERSTISIDSFTRFMESCGKELVTLYMSSCKFVNSEVLKVIANNCPKLKELDVSSCKSLDSSSLQHLTKITTLERLNLYRTMVDRNGVLAIIKVSPNLKHLNLGACTRVNEVDTIAMALGNYCKGLISLDLWRCRSITETGLDYIADRCSKIEELDLGWCSNLKSGTNCFIDLVQKCPNIRKLYLTANRTLCDEDLYAFAKYCNNLEQLDILGTGAVQKEGVYRVLQNCPKMIFCDVSFCANIDVESIAQWKIEFPKCSVKRSFQE